MTIAIFGNSQKSLIKEEVSHLLDFFQRRGVDVILSHELRQELNLREYKSFEDADSEVEFALSVGGDGTFLTTAAAIIDTNSCTGYQLRSLGIPGRSRDKGCR